MEFHEPVFLLKIDRVSLTGLLADATFLALQLTAVLRIYGVG
jgi:hypothetical protein